MLARFSHYLHGNQAPSESETREIKGLRASPLEEISRIDVDIKQIECTLDSLKRKRANIQKSVDECNTILAPVRRLSMDILSVIFTHCLATHRNPIMDPSEAPMLLTQICRDWRFFALSIPRLWSRFHVPLLRRITPEFQYWGEPLLPYPDGERRMEARSKEVQRWLKLSGACPLSISIIPTSSNFHQQPLDAIIQSCRRWQQLELGSLRFDSNVWKRIISLSTDDLCMLRELRLHSTRNSEWAEDLWYESGLFAAQGLRSISIGDIHQINVFPTGIPPNWKNLNHLFIHTPIELGLANQLLSHCCNLVACAIGIVMPWSNYGWDQGWDNQVVHNHPPTAPVTLSSLSLPHLDFLSLQGDPTACNQLFHNIETQSLRILHCNGQCPTTLEASGLFNLLQRINSLEILMIDCENITGDNPLKFGTLSPSVKHLILGPSPKHRYTYSSGFPGSHPEPPVEFMTALYELQHQYSPHSEPTVLFPSLEVLEAYHIRTVTDATLLELIIARIDATRSNASVSKLKKVLIEFSRPRQTDIVPEALAYAQAAGIELELELTYVTGQSFGQEWSPSFGLTGKHGTSWMYSSYDSCFDM
jgi:hypothetical protein